MTLSRAEVLAGIEEVANQHVGWSGELRPEMRLVEDLELDSIKSLTLALEVENAFRVELDQAEGLVTVGDLVDEIRRRLDDG
ncbi:MAG: phosphopantetheine-binding protein [Holophagae bacterium]|jgi:acyl carrier protein